jgi:hypothetical protein
MSEGLEILKWVTLALMAAWLLALAMIGLYSSVRAIFRHDRNDRAGE